MPRIDPLQLLKCLSVLLTPEGGILSREEVPRLVNLMTKFSKKLVSKCVYVLILKNTETELVDMFMAEGGWTLIQTWLQDAVQTANWDLVREILGLLLVTPVDVERLKLNILPKLIKSLSRREELEGVAELSAQLVLQWLTIVKGSSTAVQAQAQLQPSALVKAEVPDVKPAISPPGDTAIVKDEVKVDNAKKEESKIEFIEEDSGNEGISTGTFYKSIKKSSDESKDNGKESEDSDEKDKNKERKSSSSKSSKSSSSKSSSSRDKSRSKDESKDKRSSSRSSSSKSSSSSRSKDKDRKDKERSKDKDRDKDKDRHKKNGEIKTSSSSSSKSKKDSKDKDRDKEKEKHKSDKSLPKDKIKEDDDKQAEKDKDTLAKLIPPPIDKLGRIPKKSANPVSASDKEKNAELELKKKSFSVGIRKDRDNNEDRPKTVKVFNSKMRSTGLEEEIKAVPSRPAPGKKPTPSVQLPTIPQKRPSPPREIRESIVPPEKKLKIDKIDIPERPGAIKLIPPKPKPMLQESDLFNDALTAATTKKDMKKRKRRPSISKDKDTPTSPSSSPASDPPATPTSPTGPNTVSGPALGLKNIAPINFYQDTLSAEVAEESNEIKESVENNDDEDKENSSKNVEEKTNSVPEVEDKEDTPSSPPRTPTDDKDDEPLEPKRPKLDDGLKGVLLYSKKKGPKKSISWKNETDLVEIRYFELDETERVNVTKTFGDMAKMDISSEREALQLSRKVGGEDLMEAQIKWRVPYLLELDDPLAPPGSKSLEKDIQFAREKSVLQALYFDKRRIPDSPEEPIPENHQMSDHVVIPLEDPESQEIDLRSTPWPEPKGLPPQPEPKPVPPVFPNMQVPFQPPFNNMNPPGFQGLPQAFVGPRGPMGPIGPGGFIPPNMIPPNNVMVPPNMGPPHELMNMNPNMFPHGPAPDNFIPAPDNFGPIMDNFGPPVQDCFPPPGPDGFGPGPEAFGPGPGPDFSMFQNQNQSNNINMFHSNKFRDHRPSRGFRRGGGGNSGGWKQISGNSNNWKKGRGGRLCKNVQNHGFCRNRDKCPFVHP